MIFVPSYVKNLKTYKAGKSIDELAREKGLKKIVKLASNENPLGPSPKAIEAIKNSLSQLHRYSEPGCFTLVNAIGKKFSIEPSRIFCASGSDAIIQYIISAFSETRDKLISSEGTFIGWYVNTNKLGRVPVNIRMNNYAYDLNAISRAVSNDTKIVYLANPNNPTGTMFSKKDFEEFVKDIPGSTVIILDEAYTLYAQDNPDYPNGLDYDLPNLLVLRTLSKSYGLAGLRLGFCFGQKELIQQLYKVRLPFEPNSLSQEAAIAAFDDEEFLIRTAELNKLSLEMFRQKFDKLEIKYTNSFANFLMLIFDNELFAANFTEECMNRGLILRHVNTFGIPNGVRINSGTIEETEFALQVIEEVITFMRKK